MINLRLREIGRSTDQLLEVVVGEYLPEERHGRETQAAIAQGTFELRKPP